MTQAAPRFVPTLRVAQKADARKQTDRIYKPLYPGECSRRRGAATKHKNLQRISLSRAAPETRTGTWLFATFCRKLAWQLVLKEPPGIHGSNLAPSWRVHLRAGPTQRCALFGHCSTHHCFNCGKICKQYVVHVITQNAALYAA